MGSVKITDNSAQVEKAFRDQVEKFLIETGIHLQAEASDELENSPRRVDTGRLRASIVFATETESGKNESPATPEDSTPHETPEKHTLYIGTNVEYAPYVHEGTMRMAPNRFLRNAVVKNQNQLKEKAREAMLGK
jgi:hypothetical protein